jgi:stress response protein YsnF
MGHERQLIALERKIDTIIRYMIANDKIYKDETGYQKGETQKRRLLRLRYSRLINI